VNALRSTLLLTSVSSLVLGGCALKNPPFGADIMPESARAKIPGHWAGPHRNGNVVPNWILTFHDPRRIAFTTPSSGILTSKPPRRVSRRRVLLCGSLPRRFTHGSR